VYSDTAKLDENKRLTNELVMRAKVLAKVSNDNELAQVLGMSKNNLSNQKQKGTLKYRLLDWATEKKYNLNWLFYGGSDKE
jgi:hypothetical protein